MKKKEKTVQYPYLEKLGVIIYSEPYPHIKSKELRVALKKNKISVSKFNKLFGIQTMIVVDGVGCPYPWDCELVLKQIFENYKPSIWEWD